MLFELKDRKNQSHAVRERDAMNAVGNGRIQPQHAVPTAKDAAFETRSICARVIQFIFAGNEEISDVIGTQRTRCACVCLLVLSNVYALYPI